MHNHALLAFRSKSTVIKLQWNLRLSESTAHRDEGDGDGSILKEFGRGHSRHGNLELAQAENQ